MSMSRAPRPDGYGMQAMMRLMQDRSLAHPPYAPPILKSGKLVIAQTANILLYLGPTLIWRRRTRRGGCGRCSCSSPSPIS